MKIYGAGIAGLLAGCTFQNAKIFEAGPEGQTNHKALLRFRTSAVGDAVGVDFRKVRVHKGVWHDNDFVKPNIMLSNLYSKKVIGRLADRSIWNLDPVDRFIAPEDFIPVLAERCSGRIEWNHQITAEEAIGSSDQAISTLPMNIMAKFVGEQNAPEFSYAPISVQRYRVKNADVFQTIYFPDPWTKLYRASITGDMLIVEYTGEPDGYPFWESFGLHPTDLQKIEKVNQRYGKISSIDDNWRKKFIFDLSHNHNIYSLGRFGTWRNILLDDVIKDIAVIKKLMNSSGYERSRNCAK